ncbi:hypothetical protein JYU34_007832 [Plutella xylostella]|uniref:Uncharacterized protein n=1 Tax=Plutella xylostella TaxID=51655 RepID=A0ABQ7QRD0_PLUXY|nr:hypothetical protein JYU34_007832 [Plutella xylostella]
MPRISSPDPAEYNEETYVDVRSLPLKPPQPQVTPDKAVRRPWHPVMWDDSILGITPPPKNDDDDEFKVTPSREYPHKQRIRNLRRLIANGKIKPTSETLIFFLCNKFAVSDDRGDKGPVDQDE